MKDLSISSKEEYNNIPVHYCKRCLSLKVLFIPSMENSDYCDECGSTDIGECYILEWEKLYEDKKGFKYINK